MLSQKKTRIIKIIILVLLVAILPLAIIVACFVDWSFPPWIYISGSSTMQPLLQDISKIYNKAEIIVDGVGSSTGISSFLDNKKDMASISKEPTVDLAGLPANGTHIAVEGTYSQEWNENKIKTLTIAWDGIGIIYKYKAKNFDINLDLNQNNIVNFYNSFGSNSRYYLHNNTTIDTNSNNGLTITPFARLGGAGISGTAEAFLDNSHFNLVSLPTLTKLNLQNGNYPSWVRETSESNLQTWTKIRDYNFNDNELIITYLSAGFIYNNLDEIKNNGFKIATYNNFPLIKNKELNLPHQYQWYRPFNLLFKVHQNNDIDNFVLWLEKQLLSSSQNNQLIELIKKMGYKPLTTTEWTTMKLNNNILVSDYELLSNVSQYNQRSLNHKWYGAY